MFHRRYKENQIINEKVDRDQHLQKLDERVTGSEAPAARTSIENNWSTSSLHHLFGYRLNKDKGSSKSENKPTEQQQRVASLDGAATTTAHPPEKEKPQKRKRSFWRLFNCFRRKTQVFPLSDDDTQDHQRSSLETEIQRQGSNGQEDNAVIKHCQEALTNIKRIQVHPIYSRHSFFLGFPNPSMICYMNASLQSLLTLKEFVEDIRSQGEVLALCPEAQLMRCFLDIVRCRSSADARLKLEAVMRFKRVLSVQAPEFEHGGMKDAHEFLTAVLDQIRNLVIPLTATAASMGSSYSCPVQRHLLFKMQNTRTCKGCGVQSRREEDFTMLSLDLIPGGSVQDMLHIHQMERELEFRCQCGGNTSVLESRLLALPK
ncbi:hypothetical protein CHARACLAT_012909 [Characodon lateralis]|uniref:USP domain-containing protein n=1 Tax=Characodon lateralis TaxID=208331 RepID=A0ABU7EIL8_9TELE|nr:hypothetical protein [Characodon lateralis]